MESEPVGTIIFSTAGRSDYGFDIFSADIQSSSYNELRLTDDISINFNGQFVDDHQTTVFVSERTASAQLYLTCHGNPPQKLPCAPSSLFHDHPVVCEGRVFFVSAHEPPASPYKSWPAIYSTVLDDPMNDVIRLTQKMPLITVLPFWFPCFTIYNQSETGRNSITTTSHYSRSI